MQNLALKAYAWAQTRRQPREEGQTVIEYALVVALRKAVLQPEGVETGMEAFNHEQFDAPYVGAAAEVLNACAQVPMLATRRLVELSSPEDFGRHKRAE